MIPQPAVPASTVTYTNACGQTALVTVIGGTVTHITVAGSDQATATNFTATVPAGATIAITYSVVPAWYWSVLTPAVPSSTVALANTTGKDISIVLGAGTVTHVTVNGTDRATSSPAVVMLPAGESISLTYSVAPVWAWLDFMNLDLADSLGTAYAAGSSLSSAGPNGLPYAAHAQSGLSGWGAGVSN